MCLLKNLILAGTSPQGLPMLFLLEWPFSAKLYSSGCFSISFTNLFNYKIVRLIVSCIKYSSKIIRISVLWGLD